MRAEIFIDCGNPGLILESLKPDIDESSKFSVDVSVVENGLKLVVESEDISGLLAGVNGYSKLIKTVIDNLENL